MNMATTRQVYTIEQFINSESMEELTYYSLSILEYFNYTEYSVDNVVYDYLDELNDVAVILHISDIERSNYIYNPSRLSYKLYHTTAYDFIIMILNGIVDEKDFTMQDILVLIPDDMKTLLSKIYNAEKEYIIINRQKIASKESEDF